MKMVTIGLTTIICLLIASQAPADPMTLLGGYSASLDRVTEGSMTSTCPEEASETSNESKIAISFEAIKQLSEQSCDDMAETTYHANKLFYAGYDAASIVTYRHITFLPADEEADRAGMTPYKLTDMTSVCRKRTDGDSTPFSGAL